MSEERAIRGAIEGVPLDVRGDRYAVAQFEGDLVKRVWVFAEREPAARQAGLEA